MAHLRTLENLVYRVRIRPAPRTQSESSVILRHLHDFGPISTFKIATSSPRAKQDDDNNTSETHATLVFARDTKALQNLRRNPLKQRFEVTANANIPSAAVKDPYNAQGFKTRKPELAPRKFRCHIVVQSTAAALPPSPPLLHANPYAGPFPVDRSSIFGEILAKTDAPPGLIHGLLPRVDDNRFRRRRPGGSNTPGNYQEYITEVAVEKNKEDRLGRNNGGGGDDDGNDVMFRSLDLTWRPGQGDKSPHEIRDDAVREAGLDADVDIDADAEENPTGTGEEEKEQFAVLKDFSLMGLYRDAVSKGDAATTADSRRGLSRRR